MDNTWLEVCTLRSHQSENTPKGKPISVEIRKVIRRNFHTKDLVVGWTTFVAFSCGMLLPTLGDTRLTMAGLVACLFVSYLSSCYAMNRR